MPKTLQNDYAPFMQSITDTNGAGKQLADVPQLQQDVKNYVKAVEDVLPEKIDKPAPAISPTARAGNIVGKGFGILGLAGSGLQTYKGVNTFRSGGDKIEGITDVGAGTTGIVSTGALMTGRVALGTTTGGVVASLDGAKDIYSGIRDGEVGKIAVGTVKSGAGTAMIAGVATGNPVLIAGGAVAYGGAVIYENRETIVNGAKKAWNWATSW